MIVDFLKQFNQNNLGDNQGTIWATKNIDPNSNQGKVGIAKIMAWRSDTADEANLGAPAWGFTFGNDTADKYYAVADDRVYESAGINPNGGWNEVASTPTDINSGSDIISFNAKRYIATANNLKSYTQGAGFANVDSLNNSPHSFTIYANRLYVSDLDERIYSMNTSETVVKTGSNTMNLNTTTGESQLITKIKAVSNGIWIATTYTDKAGGEMIFWDGETANVASARYTLTRGALSMEIVDDRPCIIDSLGRVRVFDGTTFPEVARLPIDDESMDDYNSNDNDRFIHPNGMIRVEDEIYFLINNLIDDTTQNPIENFPSGVWAYNKNYGMYHKYSIANFEIVGGTQTDFGTSELVKVGALFRSDATGGGTVDRDNESEILAGMSFYLNATTTKAAIGVTNVIDDIKKAGYFITAQLNAENFDETWKEIIAVHDRLKNSTDRLVIKYRTYESDPIYGTGTWSEDTRFTTTTDLSTLDQGDEIEVLRGTGAGACYTIDYISGTMVRLKENYLTGMTGTLRFRGQKWQQVGSQVNQDEQFLRRTLDANNDAWIQFKVFLVGTGKSPQLIKLLSVSSDNAKTQ